MSPLPTEQDYPKWFNYFVADLFELGVTRETAKELFKAGKLTEANKEQVYQQLQEERGGGFARYVTLGQMAHASAQEKYRQTRGQLGISKFDEWQGFTHQQWRSFGSHLKARWGVMAKGFMGLALPRKMFDRTPYGEEIIPEGQIAWKGREHTYPAQALLASHIGAGPDLLRSTYDLDRLGKRTGMLGSHEQVFLSGAERVLGAIRGGIASYERDRYQRFNTAYVIGGEMGVSGTGYVSPALGEIRHGADRIARTVWGQTREERGVSVRQEFQPGQEIAFGKGVTPFSSPWWGYRVVDIAQAKRTIIEEDEFGQPVSRVQIGQRYQLEPFAPLGGRAGLKFSEHAAKSLAQPAAWLPEVREVMRGGRLGAPMGLERMIPIKDPGGAVHEMFMGQISGVSEARQTAVAASLGMTRQAMLGTSYGELSPRVQALFAKRAEGMVKTVQTPAMPFHESVRTDIDPTLVQSTVKAAPHLGEGFFTGARRFQVIHAPDAIAQSMIEYGAKRPFFNVEMLREMGRGGDVARQIAGQVIEQGESLRQAYRSMSVAHLASEGSGLGRVAQMIGARPRRQMPANTIAAIDAREQLADIMHQVEQEDLGDVGRTARRFFDLAQDTDIAGRYLSFGGGRVVAPPIASTEMVRASGTYENEEVSAYRRGLFNLIRRSITAEKGEPFEEALTKFQRQQARMVGGREFRRKLEGSFASTKRAVGGLLYSHEALRPWEVYYGREFGGKLMATWGHPMQLGAETWDPGMQVYSLTPEEAEARGMDPDLIYQSQALIQAHTRDTDADLIYGYAIANARKDKHGRWVNTAGDPLNDKMIQHFAERGIAEGAGDLRKERIGFEKGRVGIATRGGRREAINWWKQAVTDVSEYSLEKAREYTDIIRHKFENVGPGYSLSLRRGVAVAEPSVMSAVESFHRLSHGPMQRPADPADWVQDVHELATFSEKGGTWSRFDRRTGYAAPGHTGILALRARGTRAMIRGWEARQQTGEGLSSEDLAGWIAPAGGRRQMVSMLQDPDLTMEEKSAKAFTMAIKMSGGSANADPWTADIQLGRLLGGKFARGLFTERLGPGQQRVRTIPEIREAMEEQGFRSFGAGMAAAGRGALQQMYMQLVGRADPDDPLGPAKYALARQVLDRFEGTGAGIEDLYGLRQHLPEAAGSYLEKWLPDVQPEDKVAMDRLRAKNPDIDLHRLALISYGLQQGEAEQVQERQEGATQRAAVQTGSVSSKVNQNQRDAMEKARKYLHKRLVSEDYVTPSSLKAKHPGDVLQTLVEGALNAAGMPVESVAIAGRGGGGGRPFPTSAAGKLAHKIQQSRYGWGEEEDIQGKIGGILVKGKLDAPVVVSEGGKRRIDDIKALAFRLWDKKTKAWGRDLTPQELETAGKAKLVQEREQLGAYAHIMGAEEAGLRAYDASLASGESPDIHAAVEAGIQKGVVAVGRVGEELPSREGTEATVRRVHRWGHEVKAQAAALVGSFIRGDEPIPTGWPATQQTYREWQEGGYMGIGAGGGQPPSDQPPLPMAATPEPSGGRRGAGGNVVFIGSGGGGRGGRETFDRAWISAKLTNEVEAAKEWLNKWGQQIGSNILKQKEMTKGMDGVLDQFEKWDKSIGDMADRADRIKQRIQEIPEEARGQFSGLEAMGVKGEALVREITDESEGYQLMSRAAGRRTRARQYAMYRQAGMDDAAARDASGMGPGQPSPPEPRGGWMGRGGATGAEMFNQLLSEFSIGGAAIRMGVIGRYTTGMVGQWRDEAIPMQQAQMQAALSMGLPYQQALQMPAGQFIGYQTQLQRMREVRGEAAMAGPMGLWQMMGQPDMTGMGELMGRLGAPAMTGLGAGLMTGVGLTSIGGILSQATGALGTFGRLAGRAAFPAALAVGGITAGAYGIGQLYQAGGEQALMREYAEMAQGQREEISPWGRIGAFLRTAPQQMEEEWGFMRSGWDWIRGGFRGQAPQAPQITSQERIDRYLRGVQQGVSGTQAFEVQQAIINIEKVAGVTREQAAGLTSLMQVAGYTPAQIAAGQATGMAQQFAPMALTGEAGQMASAVQRFGGYLGIAPGVGLRPFLDVLPTPMEYAGQQQFMMAGQMLGGLAQQTGIMPSVGQLSTYANMLGGGTPLPQLALAAREGTGYGALGQALGIPGGFASTALTGLLTPRPTRRGMGGRLARPDDLGGMPNMILESQTVFGEPGLTAETYNRMVGAVQFGMGQMGYSMMAGGFGVGDQLGDLFDALEQRGVGPGRPTGKPLIERTGWGLNQRALRGIQAIQLYASQAWQRQQWQFQQDQINAQRAYMGSQQAFQMGTGAWGAAPGAATPWGGTASPFGFGMEGRINQAQAAIGFTQELRGLMGALRELRRDQTREGWGFQQRGMDLSYQQGMERLAMSQRMWGAGVQFQRREMGAQFQQMQMRQDWRMEDIAYGRQMAGFQYGFQMDELERAIRFSTGPQRMQLLRRREFMQEQYGMQETRRGVEEERAEQMAEWENEAFARRKEQFEVTTQLQQAQFDMQRRHIEERRALEQEQFEWRKESQEELWQAEDAIREKREEWQDKQMQYQLAELERQKAYYETVVFPYQEEQLKRQQDQLDKAKTYYEEVFAWQRERLRLEDEIAIAQADYVALQIKVYEEGGDVYQAFMDFVKKAKEELAFSASDMARGNTNPDGTPAEPPRSRPEIQSNSPTGTQEITLRVGDDEMTAWLEGTQIRKRNAGTWGEAWR